MRQIDQIAKDEADKYLSIFGDEGGKTKAISDDAFKNLINLLFNSDQIENGKENFYREQRILREFIFKPTKIRPKRKTL